MSTGINNADYLLGYHSIPEPINAAIVNVPLHRLKELFPGIQRFTAMAVIFSYHPDSPSKRRALLIKRNGKESSWGNSWETGGGTAAKGRMD
ncbi:uncharacterized protein N7484_007776 [Penicillium longicatenatum]|uniref:uncharacterized protein n=1 Tax=Penicillium longicatenatum TaxID=1561947 RepID=UPI002548BA30|nr:uncharacterized protein N7484_007776 [Penicillium longicatenatum]KAJ5639914.1 hypothetical protein N7484_007776 [Penicillium longicatenatum]